MDYKEEPYSKIPFYMTYPMQNLYLTEMEYEKDMERMKELYPKEVRKIQSCVEERCDELEYEGSRIFDENPDRMMMEREVWQIYLKLREDGVNFPENGLNNAVQQPRVQAMEKAPNRFALFPPEGLMMPEEVQKMPDKAPALEAQSRGRCNGWLCSVVGVLFSNEVYRRRCRNRRCRRWW